MRGGSTGWSGRDKEMRRGSIPISARYQGEYALRGRRGGEAYPNLSYSSNLDSLTLPGLRVALLITHYVLAGPKAVTHNRRTKIKATFFPRNNQPCATVAVRGHGLAPHRISGAPIPMPCQRLFA